MARLDSRLGALVLVLVACILIGCGDKPEPVQAKQLTPEDKTALKQMMGGSLKEEAAAQRGK